MLSLCRYKLQGLLQVNLQYEASSMPKRYQNAGSLLNRKATSYGLKSHTCSREAIILNSHLFIRYLKFVASNNILVFTI